MLRDNLVELIEPMLNSAGANPLALTHHQIQASGDRLPCLENPRPKGAKSSLTENVTSPFQAEPAQFGQARRKLGKVFHAVAPQKDCQIIEGHLLPDHVHMC